MTDVRLDFRVPDISGTPVATRSGYWLFRPSRLLTEQDDSGSYAVLPDPFMAELVDGVATVSFEPTGDDWCWIGDPLGMVGIDDERYFDMPDMPGPIDFYGPEIHDVDPETLDPTTPISPAYRALIQAAQDTADTALSAAGAAQADVDAHESDHNNPHEVTKAQVGLNNVNNTADANKPISTAVQAALDAISAAVAGEPALRDAAIAAAIANLINSAPGALDTLKELADALGDDPNFATTVLNALAGKQATLVPGESIDIDDADPLHPVISTPALNPVSEETVNETITVGAANASADSRYGSDVWLEVRHYTAARTGVVWLKPFENPDDPNDPNNFDLYLWADGEAPPLDAPSTQEPLLDLYLYNGETVAYKPGVGSQDLGDGVVAYPFPVTEGVTYDITFICWEPGDFTGVEARIFDVAQQFAAVDGDILNGVNYLVRMDDGTAVLVPFTSAVIDKELPAGGSPGQVLAKVDYSDYNVEWESVPDNTRDLKSRGTDMVTNGQGTMGDNTNFSGYGFVFDASDAPTGAAGSFVPSDPSFGSYFLDEAMPVDPNKKLRLGVTARQAGSNTGGQTFWSFLCPLDAYKNNVVPNNYLFEPGTTTTLAADLNPGDTVVHLTSAANWFGQAGKAAGASTQKRSIIWWDYVDQGGKAWAPETYSRSEWSADLWADGAVDPVAKTITLRAPWDGNPKVAGTALSNGSAAGTFMYDVVGQVVPGTWTRYSGTVGITGIAPPGAVAGFGVGWPPGTGYCQIGFLLNFQGVAPPGDSNHKIASISLSDASAAQADVDALKQPTHTLVQTLTNKRITKRVTTTASTGSLVVNADLMDMFTITALAAGLTIGAPIGTPIDGQELTFRIKDNGTARALTWNAIFRPFGTALPVTTVVNKTLYVTVVWNAAAAKWDCMRVIQET